MNQRASNSWPFFMPSVYWRYMSHLLNVTCNDNGETMRISDEDATAASVYLLRSVSRPKFWFDTPRELKAEAVEKLNELSQDGQSISWWVGKYLTSDQQAKLAASIRQSRRRGAGAGKSITISDKAHRILKRLSEVDDCSLSDVIEKRLARAYNRSWDDK